MGCGLPGSWNITTTSSAETWTSEIRVTGKTTKERDQIPLSMPSAPSRMATSKLASVFSGYAAEACGAEVTGLLQHRLRNTYATMTPTFYTMVSVTRTTARDSEVHTGQDCRCHWSEVCAPLIGGGIGWIPGGGEQG